MILDCAHYVDGVRAAVPANPSDAGTLACRAQGFVWVALNDPVAAELDELALAFGVPRTALERNPDEYRRPKLEHHGETTVLTVKNVCRDRQSTGPIEIGAVDILVGGHHAIAIGQSSRDAVEGACARLQARPDVATHGPMAAVWAVLDAVIEGSARLVDVLGDELDMLQVAVFRSSQDQSESIYLQLLQAGRFARAMHPMLAIFDEVERGELVEAPPAVLPLLGDVSDRARRLSEEVLMLTQALDGLLNANVARVTVRQNVIIQQVSAWAAIAAVATIITGIYGMNFRHMPELGWVFGYPFAIAIMIGTVVVLRWYFKRSGWL